MNPVVFLSEATKRVYQHLIGVMGTLTDEAKEIKAENWEFPTEKRALEKTLMKQMLKMLREKADEGDMPKRHC